MPTISVTPQTPNLRLLGRMDPEQRPLALDWTGSGLEVRLRGSDIWAELEAPAASPIFWMIVLADGCPIGRFPVEPGIRFYPLIIGMEAERERTITLMKETQCMPGSPDGTILVHSLRYAGELLPLAPYAHRIEFIGDSLTSGEGTLAPRDNQEWISAWFSARANYAYIAARMVNAEPRILSQSGFGVAWDCEHNPERNMVDGYEKIAGVLFGEKAEQRGCQKAYDFASWPADVVCIRLATNDSGGMNLLRSFPADGPAVTAACLRLIRVVRKNNPGASIVWILPDSHCHPELARAAVEQARAEGLEDIYAFTLPDYTPEDYGARSHPNAAWNQKAGNLLGAWLRKMLPE